MFLCGLRNLKFEILIYMKAFINRWLLNEQALIAVLIILIAPLLILCYYIHPSADDLIYSSWYKTPTTSGFWEYQFWNYLSWNGRYFSTVLLTLNPLVWGSFTGYKWLPVIILLVFYSGLYYMLKAIFNELKAPALHIISLLITVTYFNLVPSLPETLYWMAGSVTYTLTWGLTFYFFAFFLKYFNEEKHKKAHLLICMLLIFCIIGSNELSAFLITISAFLIVLYNWLSKKKPDTFSIVFLVFSAILCLIVILAPGNKARIALFENHYNFNYALVSTFKNVIKIAIFNFKNPPLIIMCFLTLINTPLLIKKSFFLKKIQKVNLFVLPVIIILTVTFFYFTSAFNMGIEPPLRLHGFISIFLILSIGLYILLLNAKHEFIVLPFPQLRKLNLLLFAAFIGFIITDFHRKAGEDIYFKGNISLAVYDITHDAPAYNREMYARYELIYEAKKENSTDITVPIINAKPKSIFFVDIKPDSTHWINWSCAQYFDLNSIKTTEY